MENEELRDKVKELFRLFKKVMEKFPPDDVPEMDKDQLEKLKMYMSQYDMVKDNLNVEMFSMMDNAMANRFIDMLIQKLREQLGDEADEDEVQNHIEDVEVKEKAFETLPTGENYHALIDSIDEQLKNPALSEEEIDILLDKRQKLTNDMNNK